MTACKGLHQVTALTRLASSVRSIFGIEAGEAGETRRGDRSIVRRLVILTGLAFVSLLSIAGPAFGAGSEWKLTVTPDADYFLPGHYGAYKIEAENVGNAPTNNSEPIMLEDVPPAGLVAEQVVFSDSALIGNVGFGTGYLNLAKSPYSVCPSTVVCKWPEGPNASATGSGDLTENSSTVANVITTTGSFLLGDSISGSHIPFGTTITKVIPETNPTELELSATVEAGGTAANVPLSAELPPLQPHQRFIMVVLVNDPSYEGSLENVAKISGGGAPAAEASATNEASLEPPFGILHFDSNLTGPSATPYIQAGGHPFQYTTEYNFGTYSTADPGGFQYSGTAPNGDPKEITAELPPGLIVNPQGVPTCSLADFYSQECPLKTVVGTVGIRFLRWTESALREVEPVYNLQPTGAYPGELGGTVGGAPYILITSDLRSGSDYGVTATSTAAEGDVTRVRLNLWGVPADPLHDSARGLGEGTNCRDPSYTEYVTVETIERECNSGIHVPAGVPSTPFITMPTECSGEPLRVFGEYNSWKEPRILSERKEVDFPAVTGCNQLGALFEPTIEASPTTNLADAPSGLNFDLEIPQDETPTGFATPALKEAVVKLPAGLSINPSSANGLEGCSASQIGLRTPVGQTPAHFTEAPAHCPDASKLGEAEVHTQLLHNPLKGSVYLAAPHYNPFGSLLAVYIVLEGEGLIIKLPGKIETDPATGELTSRFTENPQAPFEDFHLTFFGGALGGLRTPTVCGEYEATSVLTPYSYPESGPRYEKATSTFETTGAVHDGEECPGEASQQPNAPAFRAGTESPRAGAFTPFSFRLAREDGSQEISKIEAALPPGLVGKLAGVTECSSGQLAVAQAREHEGGGAEELANPSCSAASEVGMVEVGAGAGPTPYYTTGHAYLAGPYKGAPLSLAIITPAVAGPFDLGDVVVRSALYVDPFTAQIRAVSDEIPHILEGIPLDVRSVTLKMSRPNFTLNPTNCEELHFTGAETSVLGAVAPLAQRFQVGGCQALDFSPKLSLSLKGSPKRSRFPALTATLTMPTPGVHRVGCKKHGRRTHCRVRVPQQANIAAAQVTLPHSSFLANAHIAKTCGRPELASHSCPAASIYGHARAITPLLDHPLEGPVYLATGFGYELPALVADLNGQIEVLLKGKVDTGREDGIRNTFEVVPDAPVSKFTLHMFGGKKGLIENSQYLCSKHAKRKALARFTAQNGKTVELEPTVANSCGKKHKKRKGGKGHHGHRKRHGAG